MADYRGETKGGARDASISRPVAISVCGALMALMSSALGGGSDQGPATDAQSRGGSKVVVTYVEIVSNDVGTLAGLYESMHGLSFGQSDPDLGEARVATHVDGTLIGIRKPLAAHEQPIMRTYLPVEDIQQAVKKAEESGATIAYPPTRQGNHGTFAIVIQGAVEHGLWQR